MENIILLAPPAAGKGTQSRLISEFYHIPSISLGDIMRQARDETTEMGRTIIACQDKRMLVPLPIVLKLIEDRIRKEDCANGYILDGFPRTVEQAIFYEQMLASMNAKIGSVIFLDINKDLALKRTLGRIVCPNCGRNYNTYFEKLSPNHENVCDDCHHALVKRSDDNEETFDKGFQTYIDNTVDLIHFYEERDVLHKIKVTEEQTPEDIFEKVKEILGNG